MERQPSKRKSRGQALVEFALILPLLILLVFGAVDLGRAFFAYITITNAAREGARYAIINPAVKTAGGIGAATTLIKDAAVAESSGSGIVLTPSMITVSCDPSCASGNSVEVKVDYRFDFIMNVSFINLSKAIRMLIP